MARISAGSVAFVERVVMAVVALLAIVGCAVAIAAEMEALAILLVLVAVLGLAGLAFAPRLVGPVKLGPGGLQFELAAAVVREGQREGLSPEAIVHALQRAQESPEKDAEVVMRAVREAAGIYVQPDEPKPKKGALWIQTAPEDEPPTA